jgi:GT2 family glycosyltransferase
VTSAPDSVALLVLTYGARAHLLGRVLDAAKNGSVAPASILIVDNGCQQPVAVDSDGAISVECIRSETNLGSAGGYHLGLAKLLENPSWSHVWILDDDNLPAKGCLEQLLRFQKGLAEGSIGIAHRPDRREFLELVRNGGQFPPRPHSYQAFSVRDLMRGRFRKAPTPIGESIPMFAFGYGGALVPRAALQDGNCLPDPRLFLYHDDSDWSWRLGKAGFHAFLCQSATIEDIDAPWGGFVRNGASPLFSKQTDPRKLWYSLRNRAWLERNMGFAGLRHDLNAALWIALMSARTFLAERSARQILTRTRIAWRAYRTGDAGRLDPWPFG